MEFLGRLKGNRFAFEFNALMFLLIGAYTKNIMPYISFFLVLFLPGFLLCRILKRGEYESVALSIPLSYFAVGFLAYLADFFHGGSITAATVFAINILFIAAYAAFTLRERKKYAKDDTGDGGAGDAKADNLIRYSLLFVIAVAFYAQAAYMSGGKIDSEYPHIIRSFDSSTQIVQMMWMEKTGSNEFAPAMHNGMAGTENMMFTPLSVIVPTLLGVVGKMHMWNSEVLFLSIIFFAKAFGVFLLFRHFFGSKAGVVASLAAAVPQAAYLIFLPYLGVWRVPISEMLIPFLLLYILRFRDGNNYIVCALLASAMTLTHPPYLVILLPMALLPLMWLYRADKKKEIITKFILVAIVVFAITATYYFRASVLYNHPSFAAYLKSDAFFAGDSGELKRIAVGLLGMSGYPSTDNLPIKTLLFVPITFAFVAYRMKKSIKNGIDKADFFWWGAVFFFIVFLVSGLVVWWGLFMVKLRFTFLNAFVMPVTGVLIFLITKKVFQDLKINVKKENFISFLFSLIVVIALGSPWSYGADASGGILTPATYDALKWIEKNTEPNATVLFLTGYPQGAGCLSGRVCYETNNMGEIVQDYNGHGNNMSFSYGVMETCRASIIRESMLKARISECIYRKEPNNIFLDDYVVIAHYRELLPATAAIVGEMQEKGYSLVYSKDGITISKKIHME